MGSVGAVRAPGVAAGPQRRPRRRPTTHPDIAAVADPFTGVKIVFNQQVVVGGGTSLAAPVWAGLTALMTQYLKQRGGREIGDLNPMLYRVAAGARCRRSATSRWAATPWRCQPGYDLVTGLGTPDVNNLVQNLLVVQRLTE